MTVVDTLRGTLIVSCQAYAGEPLRDPGVTARTAAAVVLGGAAAVRVQGVSDIIATRAAVDVPVIGLLKDGDNGVYITPTLDHALEVARAGADVIAVDGTRRPRPDGLTLSETVRRLRASTSALVMADCGDLDDALAAMEAGADMVSTTLAGYTSSRPKTDGPDLELIYQMVQRIHIPVFAEGRIHSPAAARAAIEAGAFAVVVGTAITHPTTITTWFASAVREGS